MRLIRLLLFLIAAGAEWWLEDRQRPPHLTLYEELKGRL